MKISYCGDVEAAAKLWRACFPEDSPGFVQFYMNQVHKEQDALMLYGAEGDPRSYLGMVPYEMTVRGKRLSCSYLSGVCTLPPFRGRGYMTCIMERALAEMYRRGDVFSILIPASPALYLKFGFVDCFYLGQRPLPFGAGKGELWRQPKYEELNEWYETACNRHFDHYLHRSEDQWRIILEEHIQFERGEIWKNSGAYALVSRSPEKILVKECMGEEQAVQDLLCQMGEGVMLTPDSQKPFAQARVVNARKAMELLEDCTLAVKDPWIAENNGSFSVRCGKVTKKEKGGEPVSIRELTAMVMRGHNYMNLMLN